MSNTQGIMISCYDANIFIFLFYDLVVRPYETQFIGVIPVLPQHSLSWLEIDILNVIRWHSIAVNRFGFYLIIKILSKLDIIVPN